VLRTVGQHAVDDRLADRLDEELVHDEPLVMPAHDALGLGEDLLARVTGVELGLEVGDDSVVKAQDGEVQLRDDEVLVVARTARERGVLPVARQIEARRLVDRDLRRTNRGSPRLRKRR